MGRGYLHRGISHVEQGSRTHCWYKPSCDPLPAPTKHFSDAGLMLQCWKSKVTNLHSTEQEGGEATLSRAIVSACPRAVLSSGCPSKRSSARERGRGGQQRGHTRGHGYYWEFCCIWKQRVKTTKQSSPCACQPQQPLCRTPGEAAENPTTYRSSESLPGSPEMQRQVSRREQRSDTHALVPFSPMVGGCSQ